MTGHHHPKERRRILVFRIGELGDTLVSLPALRAIRNRFPCAHIGLLGNADSQRRHVTAREVVPAHGLIDEWLDYPSSASSIGPSANGARTWSQSLSLLATLRRSSFDTLVYLAPRIRNSNDVRRDLLFFRLAGIKRVIGSRGFEPLPRPRAGSSLPTVTHEVDHLLSRIALDEVSIPSEGKAQIDLDLTEEERQRAEAWLRQDLPRFREQRLVGFGPGSKWPSKVWPEERFLELGQSLIRDSDVYPIVFGGPEDQALGERLISGWGRGANAAGKLSVREAAAALAQCKLYVGNDTGTMHLAAAVGTSCVAVMSALDWPGHWSPYGEGHTVLRRSVPCEGCLLKVCEREGMRCLKEIEVTEVLDACRRTLRVQSTDYTDYRDKFSVA